MLLHRYEKEFDGVQDVFELQVSTHQISIADATEHNSDIEAPQRNLNNAFAYDLVPSPSVIIAALKAARRVNDFPTAVRVFEGAFPKKAKYAASTCVKPFPPTPQSPLTDSPISAGIKAKVENKGQYDEYVQELDSIRQDLGIELKEIMYPESS